MIPRPLGRSPLVVPPLCLGGNVFGWTIDEATSFAVLDAALAHGLTFIDTADIYSRWVPGHSGGESETIIGRWMAARGVRSQITLATKVGMDMGEGANLRPDTIRKSVEASLRRLQTDVIELYQAHTDDAATPQAEVLGAFGHLVAAGKVRVLGASNFSGARLVSALAVSDAQGLPRYEALQPEYNLYMRAPFETDQGPVCRENGVGVIPYFGLASGFLTGKYRTMAEAERSSRASRVTQYVNPRGLRILDALDAVAARTGSTQARVALAWLAARPGLTAPIASATSVAQVEELAAAMQLVLSMDDTATLDGASAP